MAGGVTVFNPATNQVVDMPASDAQQGYVAGKLHLPVDGKIYMTHQDGTTKVFPTGSAGEALGMGWAFSDPSQIAAKKVDVSPLQQAAAGVEGALSQVTFGASDFAERELGADREMLNARRETTAGKIGEGVGLAATLLGDAPLKLLGEGVVKSGLEKALMPTLGLTAVGDAAEAAAKKALGESLTSQAVSNLAASGIGRATEGAAIGFGGALSEESLGDPEINTSNLLAGAGMGALLGGVAGSGMRGLSEWRTDVAFRAARASRNPIGNTTIHGMVAPTADELKAALEASTGTSWTKDAIGKWMGDLNDLFDKGSELAGYDKADLAAVRTEKYQRWLRKGKNSLEGEARQFADVINGVSTEQKASSEAYYGGLKKEALNLIPAGSEASVLSRSGDAISELRAIRDKAVDDYAVLGFSSADQAASKFGNMDALLNRVEDRVFKSAGVAREVTEKITEKHPLFDRQAVIDGRLADAQVEFQERVAQHRAAAPKLEDIPMPEGGDLAARQELHQAALLEHGESTPRYEAPETSDIPESISRERIVQKKLGLQDLAESRAALPEGLSKQVFEELNGIKQQLAKPANFARSGEISDVAQAELEKRFQQAYGTLQDHLESTETWGKMGDVQAEMNRAWKARNDAFKRLRDHIAFDRDGRVDPGGLQNYLNKVDKFRGDGAVEALNDWHQAHGVFADAVDKHFAEAGVGARSRELGKKFVSVRQEIEDGVRSFNTVQRLIGRRYQVFGGAGLGGGLVGGAVGAAFGPAGAVGGMAAQEVLSAVLDPGRRALNMANMSNLMDKVAPWIDRRAKALVRGKDVAFRGATGPFGQRLIAKSTQAMLNAKSAADRRDAYHERVEELRRLADPSMFADHLASQLVGFSDHMPAHGRAINAAATSAVNYLMATMPPARPGTTGNGGAFDSLFSKPTPHDRDIQRWAEIDRAVQDPMSIVDHAHRGWVASHTVKAVETVHPHFTRTLRNSLVAHAGNLAAPPLANHSRTVSQLLGGPAADGGMVRRAQAVHQAQAQKQMGSGAPKPPQVKTQPRSTAIQSNSDKLENYPL